MPEQLRFPPVSGFTVRADFDGGALSSDFGPLLYAGNVVTVGKCSDIYRMAQAFIQAFVASYATPPAVIVLDMDHSEDPTHDGSFLRQK